MEKNDLIGIKIFKKTIETKGGIVDRHGNIFHIIVKKKLIRKACNRNLIKRRIKMIIREVIKFENLKLQNRKIIIFYNIDYIIEFRDLKKSVTKAFLPFRKPH